MERTIVIPGVELEAELGRGAFSVVYRARRGETPCAVKVGRSATSTARWFRREAAALARVNDPGVPRLFDVGAVDGRPFLIMELIVGETLEDRLARGALTFAATLRLARGLTRTLGKVHARGLVHRDVKPRNIVVDASGAARLIDFGLASQREPWFEDVGPAGTRSYAAPEQLHSPQTVDGRADLYALGRVLSACHVETPRGPLGRIIEGLTQEDARSRYLDAAAALADLDRVARGDAPLGPSAVRARSDRHVEPLVAREAELSAARAAWEGRAGRAGVLCFVGPPGSGKTRLLEAVARQCEADLVLRCEGHGPLPLAAVRGLFEDYLTRGASAPDDVTKPAHGALLSAVSEPARPLLAMISPAVARALGENGLPGLREAEAFVEATASALLVLAKQSGGALLVLDDLQRLDPLSRDVLVRVARGAQGAGLAIVAATRPGGGNREALSHCVDALGDGFTPWPMRALEPSATAAIVSEFLCDPQPDPLLVERVAALAGGTPLGTLEVLGALLDGGALKPHWGTWYYDAEVAARCWIPRDVTGLLEHRLEQVPLATRRMLEAAAVLGSPFALEHVAAILHVDPADLGFAVNDCVQAGLLERPGESGPRFVHETVREVALRGLSANALRALHQRAADVLGAEDRGDAPAIFALAEHLRLGEPERDPRRLFEVATAAAGQAQSSLDLETAIDLYAVAADAARLAGLDLGLDHHVALGEAQLRVGAPSASLASFQAALPHARGLELARLRGRIAWVHQVDGRPADAWSSLADAFGELGATLPTEAPTAILASFGSSVLARVSAGSAEPLSTHGRATVETLCALHYQCARLGFEVGRPARALASTLAILAQAGRLGTSPTLAKAYAAAAVISTSVSGSDRGYLDRARSIADELGDPATVATIEQHAVVCACISGDFAAARRHAENAIDRYGAWLEAGEVVLCALSLRMIEVLRGRPREAAAWVDRALARVHHRPGRTESHFWLVQCARRATLGALGLGESLDLRPTPSTYAGLTEPVRRPTWGPRAMTLLDAGAEEDQWDALARELAAEQYDPRTVSPVLCEYYIALAHHRARRALDAAGRERWLAVRALDAALADLAKAARLPLFKAHRVLLEGYRALAVEDDARAEARFDDAERLGRSETAPWVRAGAAHGRALLLLRAGQADSAKDEGRVAVALAVAHGAIPRARAYAADLGLELQEGSVSSNHRDHPTMSSGRAPLRALIHVARTAGQGASASQQAEGVLDEVVRALGAESGALLFGRAGMAVPCVVARATDGGTPADPARLRAPLEGLRDGPPVAPRDAQDRCVLSTRLHLGDQIVGAIRIERTTGARPFTVHDRDVLEALADQVALTLELSHVLEERERLQDSLRQAQKMEAVGLLASGIAHDFNNMLTAILSSVDGIAEVPSLDEMATADVETIRDASKRAAELTHQLLAFSRHQVLAVGTIDVNEVAAGLGPMLRRLVGPDIDLRILREATPTWISADRSGLEQAIVNLVINGRDAMPNGGVLTLEISLATLDETWVARGATRVGPHARIRVTDTGSGIRPEIRARVFEPFFTTKPMGAGTGLGLASAYGFVKQSDGHVELESEVGVGTSLLLYLPLSGPPAVPKRRAALEPDALRRNAACILLAEDEALVRKSLSRILERAGFQVLAAESGRAALDVARQGRTVDLVVTDVLMPGMSGPQLAGHLREIGVTAPVLFVSGFTRGELGARGVLEPGVEFLQKPCSSRELAERVSQLLSSRASLPS